VTRILTPTVKMPDCPLVPYKPIIDDGGWLALATATESDRPAEWPYVQQVIISRSRKSGKSIYETVRAPWQFSAFNDTRHLPLDQERAVQADILKQLGAGYAPVLLLARTCALAMLALPPECGILPAGTTLYWSPRSMQPAGSLPKWDFGELHCFTVPGIPASRFVWAQVLPAGSPGTGNQAQFATA
jgi:hypothetical protein